MKVLNIHERELGADKTAVGALIDSLASVEDRLWPKQQWPRMRFGKPLGIGAEGGHGPIRYFVEEYAAGKSVKFRFTAPKGFDGFHGYEIADGREQTVVLRHTLKMTTHGRAILSWPFVYRPLHNALLEDSLTKAQESLGLPVSARKWSLWVKLLRRIVAGGTSPGKRRGKRKKTK